MHSIKIYLKIKLVKVKKFERVAEFLQPAVQIGLQNFCAIAKGAAEFLRHPVSKGAVEFLCCAVTKRAADWIYYFKISAHF